MSRVGYKGGWGWKMGGGITGGEGGDKGWGWKVTRGVGDYR